MALGIKSHSIERFGDRVDWLIENLDPDTRWADAVATRTALWTAIARALKGENIGTDRTWKRSLSGGFSVPDLHIRGILAVFPAITREIITASTYQHFSNYASPIAEARVRWTKAAEFLALNRGKLAGLGKRYHRSVDDQPEFPLIVKRGWLLEKPMLISAASSLPARNDYVKDARPYRLDGLDSEYISIKNRVAAGKRRPTNGETYRVIEIVKSNDELNFQFGLMGYYDYINSCEALAAELADFALRNPEFSDEKGTLCEPADIPLLPHRGAPEEIYNFYTRSAGAGVNCLLLLKNYFNGVYSKNVNRSSKFVLHNRGTNTLEAQNTVHVVPAGGHQPMAKGFGDDRELSIWRTAVREFFEELFNKEEAAGIHAHGEDFFDLPKIRPLVEAFFGVDGAAKVYLLGVGLDPVTTKPEILVTIVVDWLAASNKYLQRSQALSLKVEENYEGEVSFIDLTRDNLLREASRPRRGTTVLPAGAACMLMAARHYDALIGI
jgi:hypothetical protein